MIANLHLELSFDNNIAFLSSMSSNLDFFMLGFLIIDCCDQQWLSDPVFEHCRQIIIDHPMCFFDALAFAFSGQGV